MVFNTSYLVEVHQVLHFVILLFRPLALWTIKTITKNVYVRSVSEKVLLNPGYSTNFTCDLRKKWSEKLAARTVVNVIFNNKQEHIYKWLANDSVRKEQIVDFEKRHREKVIISALNFFLPILFLCFCILNNLLIMDSLIGIMKDFV